jgi:DNA polymerase theta
MASFAFDETCRALGIPNEIKRSYEKNGLKNLYAWQVECLNDTGALQGNNVVYCAPTGGGKTLVAELVLLKTTCALRKKCIFVLPYVSLVVEKHQDIQRLLNIYNRSKPKNERVHVKSFHGESKFSRNLQEDILICTIEKANSVINALISSGQIFQLGCVIIDEMHVIGDASRGYNLEILVSKLKYLQLKANLLSRRLHIQVVALSATISNLPSIAAWFNAVLYQTDFRPVPLQEMIVSGGAVFDSATAKEIRPLLSLSSMSSAVPKSSSVSKQMSSLSEEMHQILCLCVEGLRNDQQIIIFCSSRNQCQATAKLLSDLLSHIDTRLDSSGDNATSEMIFEKRMRTVEKIHIESSDFKTSTGSNKSAGVTESPQNMLKKSILNGVAFHHAGDYDTVIIILRSNTDELCNNIKFIQMLCCC